MDSFLNIWKGLDWSVLTDMLLRVIPALVCITLHELCHGFVAYRLGDDTAKRAGRLTLNPLRHIDLVGLISMIAFRFGWAKPVPVDMRRLRRPKRDMALVALAGPLSNLLLALLALFVYGLVFMLLQSAAFGSAVLEMIVNVAYLSTALAVFNIIPIPPLDGSKVLFSALSDQSYYKLMRYERYGSILLLVLVVTGLLSRPLSLAVGWLFDRLWCFAEWGFALSLKWI